METPTPTSLLMTLGTIFNLGVFTVTGKNVRRCPENRVGLIGGTIGESPRTWSRKGPDWCGPFADGVNVQLTARVSRTAL
jgi:hypothetical protein